MLLFSSILPESGGSYWAIPCLSQGCNSTEAFALARLIQSFHPSIFSGRVAIPVIVSAFPLSPFSVARRV